MSPVTWNFINQWIIAAKLWTVLRAYMWQVFTLGWVISPNPIPAGDGISRSPRLGKNLLLVVLSFGSRSSSCPRTVRAWRRAVQSASLLGSQQHWHIKVANTIWESLSENRAIQHYFSHYCQILKYCGWKAVGEGREKPDLVFLISRGRMEVQDPCHTVSS